MLAVAERTGWSVRALRWSWGAGEHGPDDPPLGQQPPVAVGWPHHSVKAKASTER
jgi:hypothetical protein